MCRTRVASSKAIGAWLCPNGRYSKGSTQSVGAGRRRVNRIRAATVREWSSRTRIIGLAGQNRRFRDGTVHPPILSSARHVGDGGTWPAVGLRGTFQAEALVRVRSYLTPT